MANAGNELIAKAAELAVGATYQAAQSGKVTFGERFTMEKCTPSEHKAITPEMWEAANKDAQADGTDTDAKGRPVYRRPVLAYVDAVTGKTLQAIQSYWSKAPAMVDEGEELLAEMGRIKAERTGKLLKALEDSNPTPFAVKKVSVGRKAAAMTQRQITLVQDATKVA